MKLSALLLFAGLASACVAQSNPAAPSNDNVTVDDQALSRAAAAMAASARLKDLDRMMDRISRANCPVVLTSAWLAPRLHWEGAILAYFVSQLIGKGNVPKP